MNLTKRQVAYQFMELSWIKRKEIFRVLNIDNTKKEDVDLLEEIFENNSLEIIDNLINKIYQDINQLPAGYCDPSPFYRAWGVRFH